MTQTKPKPLYDPDNLPTTTAGRLALLRDILLDTKYTLDPDPVCIERDSVYKNLLHKIEEEPEIHDLLPVFITRYEDLPIALQHIDQHAPRASEKRDYIHRKFSFLDDLDSYRYD